MAKRSEKKTPEPVSDVWGYGFRPEGSKWMAYKATTQGVAELSPPGGEQLHKAKMRIFDALQREVVEAQRVRRVAA